MLLQALADAVGHRPQLDHAAAPPVNRASVAIERNLRAIGVRHTRSVPSALGRVYVVAGARACVEPLATALLRRGALVAVVSGDRTDVDAPVVLHADPSDVAVWERAGPHVEQRLGPIDGVAADAAALPATVARFADDLRRRRRPPVVALDAEFSVEDALTALGVQP
jgi:hypothetical protein